MDEVHITLNKNAVPADPEKPTVTSGVRIGTPAVTTRGFGRDEMLKIADFIDLTIRDFDNSKDAVLSGVAQMCAKFPMYQ